MTNAMEQRYIELEEKAFHGQQMPLEQIDDMYRDYVISVEDPLAFHSTDEVDEFIALCDQMPSVA